MATQSLSKASAYEQLFRTRQRRAGRPTEEGIDTEPLFPAGNLHPIVQRIAQRRAYAVVHEENKDRLRELYAAEARVLGRRDLEDVAADAGVKVPVERDETETPREAARRRNGVKG